MSICMYQIMVFFGKIELKYTIIYHNQERWNALKLSFRRKGNKNPLFSGLWEPMQMGHVKEMRFFILI